MLIPRLRKPKWTHSDAGVRLKAVRAGTTPSPELLRMVQEDPDPAVREAALDRLSDLSRIEALLSDLRDETWRSRVRRRLVALLCRDPESPPAMSERLILIKRITDTKLTEAVAREAVSPELRRNALEGVDDDRVLAEIATSDPVSAVRRAAVERITTPACWEQVERRARNKDKQIARTAREFLEAQRRLDAQRDEGWRLVEEMNGLAEATLTPLARASLARVQSRREALQSVLTDEQVQALSKAAAAVQARIRDYDSRVEAGRGLCRLLEEHLSGAEETAPHPVVEPERLAEILEHAQSRWDELQRDGLSESALCDRFGELTRALDARLIRIREIRSREEAAGEVLRRANALLDKDEVPDAQGIGALEDAWRRVLGDGESEGTGLRCEFEGVMRALEDRRHGETERKRAAVGQAESMLEQLEEVLGAGEVQRAVSIRDRIRHRLRISKGVDDRRRRSLQGRLNGIQIRLDELLKWRHWGSGQARDHLIQQAEELQGSPLPADEIGSKIRGLREGWKRIDRDEGPAEDALWSRFDAACSVAYAPFRELQAEKARQRANNLEQAESLLAELEALAEEVDWKAVDWRALDDRMRRVHDRWRHLRALPRERRRDVETAMSTALQRLDEPLDRERQKEIRRRRQLIDQVAGLDAVKDLGGAIETVKRAQRAWRPTVQAPRREEQTLWSEFRAACDRVFERQQAARERTEQVRLESREQGTRLLEALEVLLAEEEGGYAGVRGRAEPLRAEWNSLWSGDKAGMRDLDSRFAAVEKGLRALADRDAAERVDRDLRLLQRRAALCEDLEHRLLGGESDPVSAALLERAGVQWEEGSCIGGEDETRMQERFRRAVAAASGDTEARGALEVAAGQAVRSRQQLCLEAEIVGEIASPPGYEQARLELQVGRLSDALHRGSGPAEAGGKTVGRLRREWVLSGPVPPGESEGLERRFERALSAIKEKDRDSGQ